MLVIGIAGGTGSGKTTVVRKIMEALPPGEVSVFPAMATYDFITCSRMKETITLRPTEVVVVEGILVLTDKTLRDMTDVKVFVDAEADERLIRVISRDCIERYRTPEMVIDRYRETLKPMHELYIEPSKRYADLIVPQGGHNMVAIKLLTDYIRSLLK